MSNSQYLKNDGSIGTIPSGGTTGQALVKSSNSDFATQWSTVAANPAGSSGQVQYNNGGVFGGSALVEIDSDGMLLLDDISSNNWEQVITAPSAKNKLAVQKIANKRLLTLKTNDENTLLAPSFGRKRMRLMQPRTNGISSTSNAYDGFGISSSSSQSPFSIMSPSYVSGKELYYGTCRNAYKSADSPLTSSSSGYITFGPNDIFTGSSVAGGGFFAKFEFGLGADGDSQHRLFCGLINNFVGVPNIYSGFGGQTLIGIGYDGSDSQMQVVINNGNSTPTKVNINTFTGNLTSADYNARIIENIFEFTMYLKHGDTTLYCQLKNRNTGHIGYAAITGSNLPDNTNFFKPAFIVWQSGNSSTTATQLDVFKFYAEMDY